MILCTPQTANLPKPLCTCTFTFFYLFSKADLIKDLRTEPVGFFRSLFTTKPLIDASNQYRNATKIEISPFCDHYFGFPSLDDKDNLTVLCDFTGKFEFICFVGFTFATTYNEICNEVNFPSHCSLNRQFATKWEASFLMICKQ